MKNYNNFDDYGAVMVITLFTISSGLILGACITDGSIWCIVYFILGIICCDFYKNISKYFKERKINEKRKNKI